MTIFRLESGMTLERIKGQLKPGDSVYFGEGEHMVGTPVLESIHIVGVGDPRKIVLYGHIEFRGQSRLQTVTLKALQDRNALSVATSDACLELIGCWVFKEANAKYPAIYMAAGQIDMRDTCVIGDPETTNTKIRRGKVVAQNSTLGFLVLSGGGAELTDCKVTSLHALERSRVNSSGTLTMEPTDNNGSLVIKGESSFLAEAVWDWSSDPESYCEQSVLEIGHLLVSTSDSYKIFKTGSNTLVQVNFPGLEIVDKDAPPAGQPPVVSKTIHWRASQSPNFSAIIDQLTPGDTVLVEEGEYYVDINDSVIAFNFNLIGIGSADNTIVNGLLVVDDQLDLALSNLTIRPEVDTTAVIVYNVATLTMTNVVIDFPIETVTADALWLGAGEIKMRGCLLSVAEDRDHGNLAVGGAASLTARDSFLGWVFATKKSNIVLHDCSAYQIWAQESATVRSFGRTWIYPNQGNLRQLVAMSGAELAFETVGSEAAYFEGFLECGSLNVPEWEVPQDSVVAVYLSGDQNSRDVAAPAVVKVLEGEGADGQSEQDENGDDPPQSRTSDFQSMAALSEIDALIGLAKVKEQIRTFVRMVEFNQRRQELGKKTVSSSMHSMFLGNPGTGKTTVARLLGEALFAAGAIETNKFVEVQRRDLVGESLGASANLTQKVLESAKGGVLFIDEAYSLYQKNNNEFAEEAVDTLLTYMENNRNDIVVILAGYTDRMPDLFRMNPGMVSRVPNRFDFEDYSSAEIAEIGYQSLLQDDYVVDEEVYRRVVASKYERASDRSNGRWVRNFNEELIKVMAKRVTSARTFDPEAMVTITDEDVYSLAGGSASDAEESIAGLLAELDEMVGLQPVKQWVRRLITRVEVDKKLMAQGENIARPSYHMVFTGNPGTGKTTVARIIAKLFYNLGLLETPSVKEVTRSDLVGKWIGHSEDLTKLALETAMGGVLFIDEAYQLTRNTSGNDFGGQVVRTLLKPLDDDRDKFVAIFAGYTADMEEFLDFDEGLRSRIPHVIEFPDFTPEEVARVVVDRLSKQWQFDAEELARVAAAAYEAVPHKDRSNGRWARLFCERVEAEHIDYVARNRVSGLNITQIPAEVIETFASKG